MKITSGMNCRRLQDAQASRLLVLASASLAAAVVQPARAQQATPQAGQTTVQPVNQTANTLDEVVVTAQKRTESLQKVPISLSVLSGASLDKQAEGGVLEALTIVPGIAEATSDAGGMTSISIRGVAPAVTFGDGSSTVGFYLDSIPFGLVRSAALPNTDPYDLARIEVLRGPQGTLYGASALNGVVRVLTNDADPGHFDGKIRAGAAGTRYGDPSYLADGEVNIPLIQDKLAIRMVGGIDDEGGWIDQPVRGKKDVNRTITKNGRFKIDIRPVNHLKIDLTAWISREHQNGSSYADSYSGGKETQYNLQPAPGQTDFNAFSGRVNYDLPFMSISSSTSYIDFKQVQYTDYSFAIPNDVLLSSLPAKVFSEELLLSSNGNGPWRWSGGAFYRNAFDNRLQTLPIVLPGPISWSDRSRSIAGFGQMTRTFFNDRVEISGGLRYFHDNASTVTLEVPGTFLPDVAPKASFHALTPRVVASWLPNRNLTIYASYSEGFRSGLEQTPLVLLAAPLPPVQADKLYNYEIGSKGVLFDGFVTFDASVYYIKWDDVQQASDVQYNGVYLSATINGGSASGVGTDVAITLHPMQGLSTGFDLDENGLTFDQGVYQEGVLLNPKGTRLPFSPKYTGSVFADYAFPLTNNLDSDLKVSAHYTSSDDLVLVGGGPPSQNGNSLYESGTPLFVNASLDISNHAHQTVSFYAHNIGNFHGVLIPSLEATTPYRPRPPTIGIQFEAKY